jgi:hypothetical protein
VPGIIIRTSIFSILALVVGLAMALSAGSVAFAQSDNGEDLSNNETCLDCHIDQEFVGLLKIPGAQVHNPNDGSLMTEAHAEQECIACHLDITEIPHSEDVERTVNCLNCHDEQPE